MIFVCRADWLKTKEGKNMGIAEKITETKEKELS